MGVLYDRALHDMHRDVIARRGNLRINKQHYGGGEAAEAGFSQFDRSLWNRRLIAFGAEAQSLAVLGFTITQSSTSAARYKEGPTHSDAEATTPNSAE
ncbi:hypothetical protein ACFVTP_07035 [Streptomyces celluloflavus]|uniref:hypothetical protein n=1 Tax=Streptomyces celluloflavus TaxID=58344 RepID=UPI0036DAD6C3